MHVSAVMVLDPSSSPEGYDFERLKGFIGSRLCRIPEFRRKLAFVPFNLGHPVWVDDEKFELDAHVRRIGIPGKGTLRDLSDIAGDLISLPLDRSRPLWELWVCEGLENGHIGIVTKMHHATVDGSSGANMMVHLYDLDIQASSGGLTELPPPEPAPSDLELVVSSLGSRMMRPVRTLRVLPQLAGIAGGLVGRNRRDPESISGAATPLTAPRTSFNKAIGKYRSVSFEPVALEEVKEIKNHFDCTVNDVVLATCTLALRNYLEARGELPEKPLVATCPVSVHGDDKASSVQSANRVSAMFVSLPTTASDPDEIVGAIKQSTRGAKEVHKAVGAHRLVEWAELAAPNTFAQAANLYTRMKLADRHPVVHNLVISNVPGPPFPLYFAGAKLTELHPLGPVFDGAGLNVTVLSYVGEVHYGLVADRGLVPDVWELAGHFGEAHRELLNWVRNSKKAPAKKAPAKKAPAKKAPAKKAPAKKAPAKK